MNHEPKERLHFLVPRETLLLIALVCVSLGFCAGALICSYMHG